MTKCDMTGYHTSISVPSCDVIWNGSSAVAENMEIYSEVKHLIITHIYYIKSILFFFFSSCIMTTVIYFSISYIYVTLHHIHSSLNYSFKPIANHLRPLTLLVQCFWLRWVKQK